MHFSYDTFGTIKMSYFTLFLELYVVEEDTWQKLELPTKETCILGDFLRIRKISSLSNRRKLVTSNIHEYNNYDADMQWQ